jgi:hypothetical protein
MFQTGLEILFMIYSGVSAEKYMSISNRTTTDGVDIYLEE